MYVTVAGLARTLFMEHRSKFSASIDLESAAPALPAATLAAALACSGEFGVAARGGRTYGLRLDRGAVPRPRHAGPIRGAFVTGGSKVCGGGGMTRA